MHVPHPARLASSCALTNHYVVPIKEVDPYSLGLHIPFKVPCTTVVRSCPPSLPPLSAFQAVLFVPAVAGALEQSAQCLGRTGDCAGDVAPQGEATAHDTEGVHVVGERAQGNDGMGEHAQGRGKGECSQGGCAGMGERAQGDDGMEEHTQERSKGERGHTGCIPNSARSSPFQGTTAGGRTCHLRHMAALHVEVCCWSGFGASLGEA